MHPFIYFSISTGCNHKASYMLSSSHAPLKSTIREPLAPNSLHILYPKVPANATHCTLSSPQSHLWSTTFILSSSNHHCMVPRKHHVHPFHSPHTTTEYHQKSTCTAHLFKVSPINHMHPFIPSCTTIKYHQKSTFTSFLHQNRVAS